MKRLAFALAFALPLVAQAVEFNQVQPDKSAITFVYKQMGVAVDGSERRWKMRTYQVPVGNTRNDDTRPWKALESASAVPKNVLTIRLPAASMTSYENPLTHGSVPSVTLKTTAAFGAVTSMR